MPAMDGCSEQGRGILYQRAPPGWSHTAGKVCYDLRFDNNSNVPCTFLFTLFADFFFFFLGFEMGFFFFFNCFFFFQFFFFFFFFYWWLKLVLFIFLNDFYFFHHSWFHCSVNFLLYSKVTHYLLIFVVLLTLTCL